MELGTASQSKRCTKCGEVKLLGEFYSRGAKCKPCISAYQRGYREANADKVKASKETWREANLDKVKAQRKVYREVNADKLKAYDIGRKKAYYAANLDKVKASNKAYYAANLDKVKARQKVYREVNADKLSVYKKAWRDSSVSELSDPYARALLKAQLGPDLQPSAELVEAKRTGVEALRAIREINILLKGKP